MLASLRVRTACLMLPGMWLSHSLGAQASVSTSLDSTARAAHQSSKSPGLAVVVLRGRDTLLARGYGFADVERKVAVTPASTFQLGSLTKTVTAAAIMRLATEGKLRLSDSVAGLIQAYAGPAGAVRVDALLSHTSGVPNFTELPTFRARSASLQGPADVMRLFEPLPLAFTPGERWAYSNSGYILLGRIIERVTGHDWDDYIARSVLEPAKLRTARVCTATAPPDAKGYDIENGTLMLTAPVNPAVPYAAGSLCGSALDMARWMSALGDGSVIPVPAYRAMITPVKLRNGRPTSYGYGMEVTEMANHVRTGHGGSIGGYDAYAARYPADSLTVVVLMNRAGANAEALEKQLARVALGIREVVVAERSLSSAESARYAGEYRAGGGVMRVSYRGQRLHVEGPVDADLKRVAEHDFVLAEEPDVKVVFVVRGERAESITWTSRGRTMSLARIP